MSEQRKTDDYWQAYWGERFKSENDGLKRELAVLRLEREIWRDWQKLVEAERANTAEAVKQRDETNTRLSESLWRENALRECLAEALAVRDDNEAVAVERLARLALVEADAEALADALKFYGDSPYKHYHPADAPCLLCAVLTAHEALKLPASGT